MNRSPCNPCPSFTAADSMLLEASRYLLEEMPTAEMAAWEERLATDLQACEALAATVRIVAGVQATPPFKPVVPALPVAPLPILARGHARPAEQSFRYRFSGAIMGLAVALAAVAVGLTFSSPLGHSARDELVHSRHRDATRLLTVWQATAKVTLATTAPPVVATNDFDDDAGHVELRQERPFGDSREFEVVGGLEAGVPPHWLLAAVSLEKEPIAQDDEGEIWNGQ